MRFTMLAATSLAAATLLAAPPASAEVGTTCGMTTQAASPGLQQGAVYAGPVVTVNPDGSTSPVTIICSIQVGAADHNAPDAYAVAGTTTVAMSVAFPAGGHESVYLCTEYRFDDVSGSHTIRYDADPNTPGDQCALAISFTAVDGSPGYTVVPTFDICVWNHDEKIVCVPW